MSGRERPILFSAPMVRAIIAGKKTQTRRLLRLPFLGPSDGVKRRVYGPDDIGQAVSFCPYGRPGGRLWVRETWAAHWMYNDVPPRECKSTLPDDNYWFAADGTEAPSQLGTPPRGLRGKWRPSIFMPRWASRISLEITNVRVQRLHDVSEEDARDEGCDGDCGIGNMRVWQEMGRCRYHFAGVWDEINGERAAWASNPWVWAVTFSRSASAGQEGAKRREGLEPKSDSGSAAPTSHGGTP